MYGNYSWNQYFSELHAHVQKQSEKIKELEGLIESLRREIETIKEKPYTNIERIEYKFDQLKVETLEGTLNIGLNPSDGEAIEDFAVKQEKIKVPQRTIHSQMLRDVEDEIDLFLQKDCDDILHKISSKYNVSLNQQYKQFIIDDIRQQIHARIEYYFGQIHPKELGNTEVQMRSKETITNKVKADIENSMEAFLQNLPTNLKEE